LKSKDVPSSPASINPQLWQACLARFADASRVSLWFTAGFAVCILVGCGLCGVAYVIVDKYIIDTNDAADVAVATATCVGGAGFVLLCGLLAMLVELLRRDAAARKRLLAAIVDENRETLVPRGVYCERRVIAEGDNRVGALFFYRCMPQQTPP
jgi:hypothetical protein